jgi:hypothetical protein
VVLPAAAALAQEEALKAARPAHYLLEPARTKDTAATAELATTAGRSTAPEGEALALVGPVVVIWRFTLAAI